MKRPMLQPDLFNLSSPPVKPSVELSTPGRISLEERTFCVELLGANHDREPSICGHCREPYLLHSWHRKSCSMGVDDVAGSTSPEAPQTPTVSAPQSGLVVEGLVKTLPPVGHDFIGWPTACLLCQEVVPTLQHLDLLHSCLSLGLRGRLLSAYLWPEHARGAEVLDLDIAELRRLILLGGYPERERELARLAGGQRELSPNSDPSSLTSFHPYKGPGVKDGAAMAPAKWMGKKG